MTFAVPATITWDSIENEVYNSTVTYENMSTTSSLTANIIRQIADGIGVIYFGAKGTFATAAMAKDYLENELDYTINRIVGLRTVDRLEKIVVSLNNNKPVFMNGVGGLTKGHSWVVDGYMKNENSDNAITDYLIHCNFGWNGNNNGWYFIKVLDSNKNNDDLLDEGSDELDMKYSWLFRYLFFE